MPCVLHGICYSTPMRAFAHNRLIGFLLCFVLLAKLALPTGFMPDLQALSHGVYKITICTGEGAKQIAVGQGQKQDHQAPQAGHDQCPFAGAHLIAPPVFQIFAAAFILIGIMFMPRAASRLSSFAENAAWPRGPPVLN